MKKQSELYRLDALLKRIAAIGEEEPSEIIESERPDFIVKISGQPIGVEVTMSMHQEYIRASKLHLQHCPDNCISTTHLQDRGQRRSNEKLLADMLDPNSKWKDSAQDMRDWRDKVANSLKRKRAKLLKHGYKLFDQNWLLIYDEPGLANDVVTYNSACHHAEELFSAPFLGHRDFDTIFLLSNRYLFRWHQRKIILDYLS